jgi:hypothetical protein
MILHPISYVISNSLGKTIAGVDCSYASGPEPDPSITVADKLSEQEDAGNRLAFKVNHKSKSFGGSKYKPCCNRKIKPDYREIARLHGDIEQIGRLSIVFF